MARRRNRSNGFLSLAVWCVIVLAVVFGVQELFLIVIN